MFNFYKNRRLVLRLVFADYYRWYCCFLWLVVYSLTLSSRVVVF